MDLKKKKTAKTGRNRNITVDRISELHESFIHDHIMSRLSRRDRARTAVLSKTWYQLNQTYPALDIDFVSFHKGLKKENHDSSESCKSLKSLRKHASKSLRRFLRKQLRLQSLRVRFGYHCYPGYKDDLDRWVELALDNRVEKLKLFRPCFYYDNPEYSLPQPVYFSATLTTVKLVNCVLDQPLSLFRSLKKLTLRCCSIKNNSIMLKHYDCPALESLALDHCCDFGSFHISNLVRLHTVKIRLKEDPVIVEIASQSLQKLSIDEYINEYINDRSFWKGINIDGCSCLKFLYLYSKTIKDKVLSALLSKPLLLEGLYVIGCERLKAMHVSNPRLKNLVVCPIGYSPLKSIDINVPTIKNFIFRSCRWEHTEINVQANCCLETLMICRANIKIHELVAKFPRLQNLWIVKCYNQLKKVELPNLQLKRLHIVGCSELKGVNVASCELEMHYRDRKDLDISIRS